MGRKFQIETKDITLLPIGGMASMYEIPKEPKKEGLISIAGLFVSLLLAAIAYGLSFVIKVDPFNAFFDLVALMNFLLFCFNVFIPAIPLDGGRVLRAIFASRMPHLRATMLSVRISHLIAMGMAIVGLVYIQNLWLLIIAAFISVGANTEGEQANQRYLLKDINEPDTILGIVTRTNVMITLGIETVRKGIPSTA